MPALSEVCYVTRERVQYTLDQADAVRNNARVDECIQAASRDLEGDVCHRRFYPTLATRYPDYRWVSGGTLWLNHIDYEILSVISLVVDGETWVQGTDFYLDCQQPGGGFTAIRLYSSSNVAWSSLRRGIALTGQYGGSNATAAAGDLVGAVTSSATSLTVTDASLVGVGDLVLIDSERVLVTEKTMTSSTATVSGTVASSNAATTVAVSDGTKIHAGEQILIGSERMFVESVTGNNLTVKRATHASVLASHSALDVVYVPRVCTVVRGMAGTTAASHSDGADLTRNAPPSMASEASLAMALTYLEQGSAAYARTVGTGDAERAASGAGLKDVLTRVDKAYGRHARIGVSR